MTPTTDVRPDRPGGIPRRALLTMTTNLMRRAAVCAAGTAVLLGGVAVPSVSAAGTSAPAEAKAGSWHCNSSSRSLDNPGYSGPWADNVAFKVKVCSKRSGGTVYGKSRVSWSTPSSYSSSPFDGARLRTYVKKSKSGSDPVRCYKTSRSLRGKFGKSTGSYTAEGVGCRVSKYGRGDAALRLNWNNDGKGTRTYKFSAAPRV